MFCCNRLAFSVDTAMLSCKSATAIDKPRLLCCGVGVVVVAVLFILICLRTSFGIGSCCDSICNLCAVDSILVGPGAFDRGRDGPPLEGTEGAEGAEEVEEKLMEFIRLFRRVGRGGAVTVDLVAGGVSEVSEVSVSAKLFVISD
jgi:hypothetical protein